MSQPGICGSCWVAYEGRVPTRFGVTAWVIAGQVCLSILSKPIKTAKLWVKNRKRKFSLLSHIGRRDKEIQWPSFPRPSSHRVLLRDQGLSGRVRAMHISIVQVKGKRALHWSILDPWKAIWQLVNLFHGEKFLFSPVLASGCCCCFPNLIQSKIIREEGPTNLKLPLSGRLVSKSLGLFSWLITDMEGPSTLCAVPSLSRLSWVVLKTNQVSCVNEPVGSFLPPWPLLEFLLPSPCLEFLAWPSSLHDGLIRTCKQNKRSLLKVAFGDGVYHNCGEQPGTDWLRL